MLNNLPDHAFTSTAVRKDDHWLVECDQHPGVRSKEKLLVHAREDQRQRLAAHVALPESRISVDVRARLPAETSQHLDRARELRGIASWANVAAAREVQAAALTLVDLGLSLRDIGTILGVSHQRAHQIIHSQPGGRRDS
jgi:DNA-directed RNA polymerase specialized sigma24 family protein